MPSATTLCVRLASRPAFVAFLVLMGALGVAGDGVVPTADEPATTPSPESPEDTSSSETPKDEEAAPEDAASEKAQSAKFRIKTREGKLEIATAAGESVATYVFADDEILRPYFMHVHAPCGTVVTRNHPPREGVDLTDHATMHPGVWLGFGDLSGADFWRNKGRVEHVEFVEPPKEADGVVSFAVRNRYVSGEKTVCSEVCRHTLRQVDDGYLLTYDSTFSDEKPFVFGDQEEMGLGLRVAAPLRVRSGGGTIENAEGMTNEEDVWGKTSDFCSYGAIVEGRRVGLLLAPHPENFRKSWFHARDYGFLAANPFGRKSFMAGEPSRVTVKPGETLRLRFGILAYSVPENERFDAIANAKRYVALETPPSESVDTTEGETPDPAAGPTAGESPTTSTGSTSSTRTPVDSSAE